MKTLLLVVSIICLLIGVILNLPAIAIMSAYMVGVNVAQLKQINTENQTILNIVFFILILIYALFFTLIK